MGKYKTSIRPDRDALTTDTSLEPEVSVNGAPPLIQPGDVDTAQVCGRCHTCGASIARLHIVDRAHRTAPPIVFLETIGADYRLIRQPFDTATTYRSRCVGCGWSYSTGALVARNRGRSLRWARR